MQPQRAAARLGRFALNCSRPTGWRRLSLTGARALGAMAFHRLALLCRPALVVALGGMNRAAAAKWSRNIVHGWAAIDAFRR